MKGIDGQCARRIFWHRRLTLGQSAQTAMPAQMNSRAVNMMMPNVVWLMSFLRVRGEVDACNPDYNTDGEGESCQETARAEEDTYKSGSDGSRPNLAKVVCNSCAFF